MRSEQFRGSARAEAADENVIGTLTPIDPSPGR